MGIEDKRKVIVSQPPIPGFAEAVANAEADRAAKEKAAAFRRKWEAEQAEKRDDKDKGKYQNY